MAWEIFDHELLERYAAGERNFAGIKLLYSGWRPSKHGDSVDLDGVVLRDINLRGAYLHEVMMIGVDLTGADMGGIFLDECCLAEGIIRNANLCAANVFNSSFTNADLRETDLDHINATFASFRGAYLRTLERAILLEADFKGAHTEEGLICRCGNLIWNTTMPDGSIIKGPMVCSAR